MNNSYLMSILQTPAPETLFHYTSSTGLLGILQKKNIWTTKIHYLNDGSELLLAFKLIREKIESLKNNENSFRTSDELGKMLEILDSIASTNVSLASFTAEGDQLSQWRGYCAIGDGYSIGFHGAALQELVARNEGYYLFPCIYEEEKQRLLVDELINTSRVPGHTWEESINSPLSKMEFAKAVLLIAPMIKDKGFKDEREWRLITPQLTYDKAMFRKGKFSIIPYWEFDIDLNNTMQLITVGPTPEAELAKIAVDGLLFKELDFLTLIKIKVVQSKIPFRNI